MQIARHNHQVNPYAYALQRGFYTLEASARVFAKLFTRAVNVVLAPATNIRSCLGLPKEIWQYGILPNLQDRDIENFSNCSQQTLAICYQRFRVIDFNLLALTEESFRRILREAAGAKNQKVRIVCSADFKDVELIRNALARYPDLSSNIIELNLSEIEVGTTTYANTIAILLTKVPNLQTLALGKIGTGPNGYVKLQLPGSLQNLEKIDFNGQIFGSVIFPTLLGKLKEINHACMLWELSSRLSAYREHPWSYPYQYRGRTRIECHGTLDLRQCSLPSRHLFSREELTAIKYFLIPVCLVLFPTIVLGSQDLKVLASLLLVYGFALYLLHKRS